MIRSAPGETMFPLGDPFCFAVVSRCVRWFRAPFRATPALAVAPAKPAHPPSTRRPALPAGFLYGRRCLRLLGAHGFGNRKTCSLPEVASPSGNSADRGWASSDADALAAAGAIVRSHRGLQVAGSPGVSGGAYELSPGGGSAGGSGLAGGVVPPL